MSSSFTNWPSPGEWASQKFRFVLKGDRQYISLAITGKNHTDASYVAFDVLPAPTH